MEKPLDDNKKFIDEYNRKYSGKTLEQIYSQAEKEFNSEIFNNETENNDFSINFNSPLKIFLLTLGAVITFGAFIYAYNIYKKKIQRKIQKKI